MLEIFRGVCSAVEFMHTFKVPSGARTKYTTKNPILDDEDAEHQQDRALLSSQEASSAIDTQVSGKEGQVVPWAHRDIKPG